MKRFLSIGSICIMMALLGVLAYSCSSKNKYQSPPLSEIEVSKPIQMEVTHFFEYPAYTQALNTVDLVARVSGFLESINYQPGSRVNKGDLLFVIEPQAYKDKVNEAAANVSNTQAELRLTQESLKRVLEAAKSNAVSQIDVIKAQTAVDQSKAALKSAQSQLDMAEQSLQYCYVRAPFSGRITKNLIDQGNFVNNAQVLATIYEDNQMYVNFRIEDSKYIILLKTQPDQKIKKQGKIPVEIMLNNDKDLIYDGTIDYISPNVDLSTGTFAMRAIVNNPKGELSSGLYVRVRVPYEKDPDAVVVPAMSIGSDQSGSYVYVLGDSNVVKYRSVQIEAASGDNLKEITKGLNPNELFVTKALLKVTDGQTIKPVVVDLTASK
ncbi:MAG: efflux RND transporter periplasmic adaptor subunit [Bacteroidales bacterium]